MSDEAALVPSAHIDLAKERDKPRLLAILFCDSVRHRPDGKESVIGIFDRVYVHPEVKITPRFYVYVRTAETRSNSIRITVYAPNGEAVMLVTFGRLDLSDVIPGLPLNVIAPAQIDPFHADIEGVYWFDVSYLGESLGGAGLVIEHRHTEEKASGTDTYP